MGNTTRCRLLAPPNTSPIFQPVGHRSGEGTQSLLELLKNDPARKAADLPAEGHPGVEALHDHNN